MHMHVCSWCSGREYVRCGPSLAIFRRSSLAARVAGMLRSCTRKSRPLEPFFFAVRAPFASVSGGVCQCTALAYLTEHKVMGVRLQQDDLRAVALLPVVSAAQAVQAALQPQAPEQS